jgi:hypothetical protein
VKGKNELKEFLSVTVDLLEGGSLEAEAERTGIPLDEDFLQKLLQVYISDLPIEPRTGSLSCYSEVCCVSIR